MCNLSGFHECVKDLSTSDVVLKMDSFVQHGDISTLEHVLAVAYTSYLIAERQGLDARLAARGAMLHDLYLYDWHISDYSKRLPLTHGFVHPKFALENARIYFEPTEKEQKIIRSHMWPLTIFHIPSSREGFVVSIADKYCATNETLGKYDDSDFRKTIKKYMRSIKEINAAQQTENC